MNEVLKFIIALKWSEQLSYLFQEGDLHKNLKTIAAVIWFGLSVRSFVWNTNKKVNKRKTKISIFHGIKLQIILEKEWFIVSSKEQN